MKYRVNEIALDFSVDYEISLAEKQAVTESVTGRIWEAEDVYDLVEQITDLTAFCVESLIDYEEVQ